MTDSGDKGHSRDDLEPVGAADALYPGLDDQGCPRSRSLSKQSSIVAALVSADGVCLERGWEAGALDPGGSFQGPRAPRRDDESTVAGGERTAHVAELGRRLLDSLVEAVPLDARDCRVRVVDALVADEAWGEDAQAPSRLTSVHALLGRDAQSPVLVRTTLVNPSEGRWPEGVLAALARACRGWSLPERVADAALDRFERVVLDAFAFGDLLRVAGRAWERGAGPGAPAPSSVLEVDEMDLARSPGSEGRPVLREGALVGTPSSLGLVTRASWRERPRPGWRGLVARLPEAGRFEDESGTLSISALHVLPGVLIGSGTFIDARSGALAAPLVQLPAPPALLSSLSGALEPGVLDATGLPVLAPAATLDVEALRGLL